MSRPYQPSSQDTVDGSQSDNDTAPTVASLAAIYGAPQLPVPSGSAAFGSPFAATDAASLAAVQRIAAVPQQQQNPQAPHFDRMVVVPAHARVETSSRAQLLASNNALFPTLEPQLPPFIAGHFRPDAIPHLQPRPLDPYAHAATDGSNANPTGNAQQANGDIDHQDSLLTGIPSMPIGLSNIAPIDLARYERNTREQQRSQRINDQIQALRDLLQASHVPIGPGHKYAVLIHVAKYMQELQSRAIVLDSEHSRLLETIRSTTQVLEGKSTGEDIFSCSSEDEDEHEKELTASLLTSIAQETMTRDDENPDYEAIFQCCPYPLGILSLDGVVLTTNPEFERLLSNPLVATTCSVRNQSIFVFVQNHQELFQAMSALLEHAKPKNALPPAQPQQQSLHYWHGTIQTANFQSGERIPATLTLTNTAHGNPEYFSLLVVPLLSE